MNCGGRREGAGRPKGSRNKASVAREAEIAESGKTPLEFLLDIMRDESADMEMRMSAAKAAAPFVHPRLANQTLVADIDVTNSEPMSDFELARRLSFLLETRAAKAGAGE